MSILPTINLVSNAGLDENATHTTGDSDLANLISYPENSLLKYPADIFSNIQADFLSDKNVLAFRYSNEHAIQSRDICD